MKNNYYTCFYPRPLLLFLLLTIFWVTPLTRTFVFAQSDDDELFGSVDEPLMFSLSNIDIFSSDTVRIGGSLSSSLEANINWVERNDDAGNFQYDTALIAPDIRGAFFIDARPSNNLRIYNKFIYSFPFETSISLGPVGVSSDVLSGVPSGVQTPMYRLDIPNFNIFELFTDFSYNDTVFFRFGKHTIKWGVGYFFSPADVLNLTMIDPQEPLTQLEGPISLRTQVIFKNSQNVLYTYLLPDTNTFKVEDTALASKFEFPVGNTELGFGIWYKRLRSPRLTLTYSGTVAKKISVSGEGVFAAGSDADWQNEKPLSDMEPLFQATVGFIYMNTTHNISLAAQYFYNGLSGVNGASSSYTGTHYTAVSVSKTELFAKKFSASLFGIFGIDTKSIMTNLALSYSFFDELTISAGPTFRYGDEYTKGGSVIGLQITANLGGGKF
jgi:hypothetical protein